MDGMDRCHRCGELRDYAHIRECDATLPGCALCGKPLAYPGARFCGAACSQAWEWGQRPAKTP